MSAIDISKGIRKKTTATKGKSESNPQIGSLTKAREKGFDPFTEFVKSTNDRNTLFRGGRRPNGKGPKKGQMRRLKGKLSRPTHFREGNQTSQCLKKRFRAIGPKKGSKPEFLKNSCRDTHFQAQKHFKNKQNRPKKGSKQRIRQER